MIWSNWKLRWMFQFGFLCAMSLGLASSVSGSLSFEIHHRFSEQVKTVLGGHGLPEMGSLDYYKALVHRDRGRQLTSNNNNQTTISFAQGNSTEEISFLHYANVTIGTPAQWFLVALDTGSDLFWLPCNCNSTCVRSMETDQGERIKLNIYNPSKSKSSSKVTCNSTLCALRNRCISPVSDCPYRIRYLSPGSKSTGVLVEDVIHMSTEEGEARDARITFGCSESQLGLFKEVAVNGIMGLAIADIAVPNMLVKAGVASDSFSMCFGPNGKGTISFGDKGSSDQLETPLSGTISPMFYDVSITKFKVGKVTVDTEFTATFDSGTAVTWLIEPYYTALTTNFHLSVPDRRLSKSVDSPFEFCYIITSTSDEDKLPSVSFEMKGGAAYDVFSPILVFDTSDGSFQVYCLAVLKQVNADFSIIGQNFMTNYRIVHDRERRILGWKKSNCNDTNGFTGPTALAKPPSMAPTSSPRTINLSSRLNPLAAASSLFIICFISFVSL
ncbi:Eukaryotic aspartyl protease family protein [Arabidopsis thaliana]|uniref:Eukaryotic aspartyl protease family protein n=3 Tax=Arabidopsis thaliana TaxID=3702 RepID=A0A1I9LQZ6_ARATH|nr:Eukaryotic aspartyl protease family protein [Arabidopsis thaliana]ANM65004.1 Eukaryotic aspartyl protease family protein [Arabidopsis thaliana]|eukprot:NP_001327003.1 Eukaryotic aspartyl protease family protein [Arabidopsis thaliana]